eukprot:16130371-Heterocapsa_arctica.AAC.1
MLALAPIKGFKDVQTKGEPSIGCRSRRKRSSKQRGSCKQQLSQYDECIRDQWNHHQGEHSLSTLEEIQQACLDGQQQ